MIRVLFVRHGETNWNLVGRYQGQRDTPLNATGREQAKALATVLADEPIMATYTSDLARCAETAHIIGKTSLIPDARLREPDYGAFTGLTYQEMQALAPEIYTHWQADRSTAPPEGEPVANVIDRGRAFLADVQQSHSGRTVLVVTHGEFLALLLCDLLDVPLVRWRQYATDNASLTTLALHNDSVDLIRFNCTGHL